MTREELRAHCKKEIEMCKFWAHGKDEELDNNKIYQEHKLTLELLEEEPFINKPCISSGVCEHDKNKVLDKIRTEIQKLRNCSCNCSDGIIDDVEDILDKYKGESEGE